MADERKLSAEQLCRRCDPEVLAFETTDDLEELSEVIGQPRAVEALRLILRQTILIDTEGRTVGQINGLSVIQIGGFAFGRPSRITASGARGTSRRSRHRRGPSCARVVARPASRAPIAHD